VAYTYKHGDRPLDGLTVQRAVGRGGFGEVYYALTDSGKQVAVKFLRDNPEVELRGIAHVMNLKSPHLITIYDVRKNEHEDPFVIMEYVSGPSLRELLNAEPDGLGAQKAAFFLNGICKGLSYLHDRGIVHRDLKPGNIFYDDGYVKIGDYGLSKHIAVSAHSGNTVSVGTVHYMAPEIGSGSYTKAIDIYALGVMLYEMLTGRLPFRGSSMGEILMKHLSDRPELGGIDEPFRSVIRRALEKDPADRFQDVNEMVDAILSAGGVQESVSTFDPSVLTAVPRDSEARDTDRTRTTPPRGAAGLPTLDARDIAREVLPPIPPIPRTNEPRGPHPRPPQARQFRERMQHARQVGDRLRQQIGAQAEDLVGRAAPAVRGRWPQLLTAFILLMALCIGVAVIQEDGAVFGAMILFIVGGTLAPLVAYGIIRKRGQDLGALDRALYGASGFILMLPAFAAAAEGAGGEAGRLLSMMIVPLSLGLALHGWTDRIEDARRARIDGGSAFWHGVAALIIGAMVGMGSYAWVAGITAASLLLATQAIAQLWPLPGKVGPRESRSAARKKRSNADEDEEDDEDGEDFASVNLVANSIEEFGALFGGRRPASPPPPPPASPAAAAAAASAGAVAAASASASREQIYIDADQPSFVGKAASAGVSFIGKLLLLSGLFFAFAYSSDGLQIDTHAVRFGLDQSTFKFDLNGNSISRVPIPRAFPLALIAFGTLGLTLSRMGTSAMHFIRAIAAGGLGLGAALIALGPAYYEMGRLFSGHLDEGLASGRIWVVFMLTVASLSLMSWRHRRKGEIRV